MSFPDTMLTPLMREAHEHPEKAAVSYRQGNRFVAVTNVDLWARVQAVAAGLMARGIQPGDRVALMSKTSLEWLMIDHAIVTVGAITVPIYETSSQTQIDWIVQDSQASLLIVQTPAMEQLARPIAEAAPDCDDTIVVIDSDGLQELEQAGASTDPADLEARIADVSAADTATIIYTSGTTGRPKGCILTHNNLRSNVHQISEALRGTLDASDTCLLFLPLAHILTKSAALFCLEHGIRIAFGTSIEALPDEFAMVEPSLIAAVPRIFEKVYAKAQHNAQAAHKGFIFERAAQVAVRWSEQRDAGAISRLTQLEHAVYDRLVYSKLRDAFGGHLRMAFSGGGPLGSRLSSFFDGTGVRVYEGYGLTETSPILTLSTATGWASGSVGPPVRDTEIRLADDGEILVKGPQVFSGYWQNEHATAEVFDADGWFHTGDIGAFDARGFLSIVGRSKDLLVTAAGKNVAPAPLEDLLKAQSLISQAMVVGDNRPFIAALITLDPEGLADWREHHDDAELDQEIQQIVDEVNTSVSRAESIRKFVVLPHDFDLESEEITPTLKVRRAVVAKHYADEIESLYEKRPSSV